MATRAQIRVKDEYGYIDLYHHSDGYPEGVGRDLKAYLGEIPKGWYAHWNVRLISNDLIKGKLKNPYCGIDGKDDDYCVTNGFHTDINYAYLIDCDKRTLKCYYVDFESDYHSMEDIFENAKEVEIPN